MIYFGLAFVAFVVATAGSEFPERKWGPLTYWIASGFTGVFLALGMPSIKRAIVAAVFTWFISWFYATRYLPALLAFLARAVPISVFTVPRRYSEPGL